MPLTSGWGWQCLDADVCLRSGGRLLGVSGLTDYVVLARGEAKCAGACYTVLVNVGGRGYYAAATHALYEYLSGWADAYLDGSVLVATLESAVEAALHYFSGKVRGRLADVDVAVLAVLARLAGGVG